MEELETDFEAAVADSIWRSLAVHEQTQEPMNALLIWTELGRGLAGTLERKGADLGALARVIDGYCHPPGEHSPVDLSRWMYRVEPARRMTREQVGDHLRLVEEEIAKAIAELVHKSPSGEGQRELFLTVVKGWFPVGVQIFRALPPGGQASELELLAVLGVWCSRYLPQDPAGPADLGVRVLR